MKELAEKIAALLLERMEPELHRAMVEKIISLSSDKWRMQFMGSRAIEAQLEAGIDAAMAGKYKPVLDYIADKKAREKIIARAARNGIDIKEVLPFFEESKGAPNV